MKSYKVERIQIVNPDLVVRVGYPWDIQYSIDNLVTKAEKEMIGKLAGGSYFDGFSINNLGNAASKKMLHIVAYLHLQRNSFGGNIRSIHTKHEPELAGHIFPVLGKKRVKTGTYVPGSGQYDDYEPPKLINVKTHTLLLINRSILFKDIWIEEKNCVPFVGE